MVDWNFLEIGLMVTVVQFSAMVLYLYLVMAV